MASASIAQAVADRWAGPWRAIIEFGQNRKLKIVLALAVIGLTIGHLAYSGVYTPLTNGSWPELKQQELPPLFGLILRGHAIDTIDPRQYGVVVFLVVHPLLALGRGDLRFVEIGLLAISHICITGAFLLTWRLFGGKLSFGSLLLFLLWYNFEPTYGILARKLVESWELLLLTLALVMFVTGEGRGRILAGLAIGVAILVKLLPTVVAGFMAVRDRLAFATTIAATCLVLLVGQFLYGNLMGIGYFQHIVTNAPTVSGSVSDWWENNSLVGIVHKLFAGFRVDRYYSVVPPQLSGLANTVSVVVVVALLAYLAFIGWYGRAKVSSPERRAVEFSTALVAMLLVSPNTIQDYMLLVLPAYSTALWLCLRGWPSRWPPASTIGLWLSAILVGQFLPTSIFVRLVPGLSPMAAAAHMTLPEAYVYYLFPGLGLVLLAGVLIWLELSMARIRRSMPAHALLL